MMNEDVLERFNIPNPHKCDRCGNGQPMPGLCPLCRLSDVEKKLGALCNTIEEYMPMAIPKGEHELTMIDVPDVGPVPVWVSVVVETPVLIMDPGHYARCLSGRRYAKVQIIKDEYQAVGGAARSIEKKPSEPFTDPLEKTIESRYGPPKEEGKPQNHYALGGE